MVVNVFLFDDFEAMDAFGPVQIFGTVPEHFYITAWRTDHWKTGDESMDRAIKSS